MTGRYLSNLVNRLQLYMLTFQKIDVVSHAKLFTRHSYGIRDSVLDWLKSFFCGRKMCTCINVHMCLLNYLLTYLLKVGLELSDVAELVSGIV